MSIATQTPKNEIAIKAQESELAAIEEIVSQCGLSALAQAPHIYRAMKMAAGIRMLRAAITDTIMGEIMELQGTRLGFRTDKDTNQGYPIDVVKDCFIESLICNANPVGNEWNIIAANTYLTKEYYTRQLDELPGLRYIPKPGVPTMAGDKGALVPFVVEYELNGVKGTYERILNKTKGADGSEQIFDERICVRVNSGMGIDAILGKATRKAFKALFERLTGLATPDGDLDDSKTIDGQVMPAKSLNDLTAKLESQNGGTKKEREPGDEDDEPHVGGELPDLRGLAIDNGCPANRIDGVLAAAESEKDPSGWIKSKPWSGSGGKLFEKGSPSAQ